MKNYHYLITETRGNVTITLVVSTLIVISIFIVLLVMKVINSGKEPEPLKKFSEHIEISIQNKGKLPFKLGGIEINPSAVINLSKTKGSEKTEVYSKSVTISKNAVVSPEAWDLFFQSGITCESCPHTLLGNLFMSVDDNQPHISVFINGKNKAGASSQYDIQRLDEGGYKIHIKDFFEHFNQKGPRNITTGFKTFSCKTSGEDDIISALSELLDQLNR